MGRRVNFRAEGFEYPEGATPISDYSDLIPTWVQTIGDLNRVEAENIMIAQRKYLHGPIVDPKIWFTVTDLKTVHRTMLENVWRWAGKYRKSITSVGINPVMIPSQLAEFCAEVRSWSQDPVELTFLEMAARVHHRLVSIHPFENGNGRFSRLISDRYLLAWRSPHPVWPSHLKSNSKERNKYIQALKEADRGDYGQLIVVMKDIGAQDPTIVELLTNNFYQTRIHGDRLVAAVRALLRCNSPKNEETPNGHRPLQAAVRAGMGEIVRLLIDAGVTIDVRDQSGLTPFQVAVQQENKDLADLLLSKGAKRQAPPGLDYAKYYNLYREPPPP
jgi:Fic-DOC domain mobile mystery protein B